MATSDESRPLLERSTDGNGSGNGNGLTSHEESSTSRDFRHSLYDFLEAKTPSGQVYEYFIMTLIVFNVFAFILASLFVEDYNDADWAKRDGGICGKFCDALWFGNYRDNGLGRLNVGATSVLELVTIAVFSVEYILRLVVTCPLEDERFSGIRGRLRYIPTFFSLVDLASTVPFYLDAFVLRDTDLAGSAFLRMFRLLRMMRVEGRYKTALTMVDDVYRAQKGILGTALFIGMTTWITVASLYYLVERKSLEMIYCGASYCGKQVVDTGLCTIDSWGLADCSKAGCPPTDEFPVPCYNLYQSIPMASYYALINLFGEFPLIDQHNLGGMIVGTLTAVVAVGVFALPASIIGNGFEAQIEKKRLAGNYNDAPIVERRLRTEGFEGNPETRRGHWYNFLHAQTLPGAVTFDSFINILVIGTTLTFMMDTLDDLPSTARVFFDVFEFLAVVVFTVEYGLRVYSAKEDPKFQNSAWTYVTSFLPMVDILSVLPYWLEVIWVGTIWSPPGSSSLTIFVKALRLLRILRFEKYTHAFTSFDDVLSRHVDVLAVTAFTAILFWVFFGALLYFTERDNLDPEMAENYSTVPNAMWVTLLNLAGEAPLAQYSVWGKVATGILGLFATGIFGIPIGILGAGFEQVVEEENADNTEELEGHNNTSSLESLLGTPVEQQCYNFVNGFGSSAGRTFETIIYILIFVVVGVGVLQTVDGHEDDFFKVELLAVLVFTVEYLIRLVGVGADPDFAPRRNGITSRVRFIFSFYSIIDLLAIAPFYLAMALPGSIVDEYDEYLRMIRIIRLVKLDKYIPSISLIDDVIRLKYKSLRVALFAAMTLWIIFAALLYLFENQDTSNEIDPVPAYGCVEDCTMYDRFQNFFDSMVYTGIHLTGDYPIITYSWPARFVNFFMVISAVGVVSVPSALIASGFVEIVQSKTKARRAQAGEGPAVPSGGVAGDDWYEHAYHELEGVDPPPSLWGPKVDACQVAVNEFLNGKEDERGHAQFTTWSQACRIFIFTVIISNVAAVVLESMPAIDKAVGNGHGNFFDSYEAVSVMVFAAEYMSRLFCAPKNRAALFSTFVYATTFFGIVDFLSTVPWFVEQALVISGAVTSGDNNARIFRVFRIFRILQLEDFVTAFSKLDNVFRASKDVLKATGLMALIIWVGCGALFYIFEENNPNWRACDDSVPLTFNGTEIPGCYDFPSTSECNAYYPGLCEQKVFTNMPNSLYLTAVFLGGEWGVVDFTWPGRFVCLFLCVVGIGLYAIPIGALFDSFGAVLGMGGDDKEEVEDGEVECP
jgi:hypothetical protein